MAKYDPLCAYLKRRDVAEWPMSFYEIERVINALLPGCAARSEWWANEDTDGRHVQCHAWRSAGFNAFLTGRDQVVFRRRPEQ